MATISIRRWRRRLVWNRSKLISQRNICARDGDWTADCSMKLRLPLVSDGTGKTRQREEGRLSLARLVTRVRAEIKQFRSRPGRPVKMQILSETTNQPTDWLTCRYTCDFFSAVLARCGISTKPGHQRQRRKIEVRGRCKLASVISDRRCRRDGQCWDKLECSF